MDLRTIVTTRKDFRPYIDIIFSLLYHINSSRGHCTQKTKLMSKVGLPNDLFENYMIKLLKNKLVKTEEVGKNIYNKYYFLTPKGMEFILHYINRKHLLEEFGF